MNSIVLVKNQSVITTSILVAEKFERNHRDILRAIKKLDCSPDFTERNFTLSEYEDITGRKLPMYQMTKDGFIFLVMGFTGSKAAKFKEDYINAFNEMHNFLNSEQLSLIAQFNKALLEFEQASDIASQAGRTLSVFGRKIKPLAAEKVAALESQLQPQLFGGEA